MKQFKPITWLFGIIALVALLAACSSSPAPEGTLETEASTAYTLLYNRTTGASAFGSINSAGAYTNLANPSFSKNWSQVVRTPNGIFFYNAGNGAARFGRFSTAGVYTNLVTYPAGTFLTGWTHIVNTPNGVFFYRKSDGTAAFGSFDRDGFYTEIQSFFATLPVK